ncbi:transporter substrate-binding domain-containing protein [Marinobacteraceae bacterium S3BR75-40.1]
MDATNKGNAASPRGLHRRFRSLQTCVAALLLALLPLLTVAEEDRANPREIIVDTGPWPPYVSEEATAYGPISRLIKTAYEAEGYDVIFRFQPWQRSKHEVKYGNADILMPAYCSEERRRAYLCSDPVINGKMVFFHRRDFEFDWDSLEDLKDLRIGATIGYFYGDAFHEAEESGNLTVVRIPSDQTNLRLLMAGRIQLYPQDQAVGYAMIREQFPQNRWNLITHHPKALHRNKLGLLFTRAEPRGEKLRQVFNRRLQQMRDSGVMRHILRPLIRQGAVLPPE